MTWNLGHALRLDVRELVRSRLQSGITRWFRGDSLTSTIAFAFDAARSRLALSYSVGGQRVDESFELTTTSPHFGGLRWWAWCPGCRRRVGVLYSAAGRFRCRTCVGWPYRSQHEGAFGRMCDAARRDLARIGGGMDIFDVPDKPKRMRWDTYLRILDRLTRRWAFVRASTEAFCAKLRR